MHKETRLLFDCGSTKCAILTFENNNVKDHITVSGFNPILHNNIEEAFYSNFIASKDLLPAKIDEIKFCGAGCVNHEINKQVEQGIKKVYNVKEVLVDTDLAFIPLALNITQPCIIAILGTGSNAGRWNGKHMDEAVFSGGYLLGDEGSAFSLGKRLLTNYIRKNFQQTAQSFLKDQIGLEGAELIQELYKSDQPNKNIASFAKFYGLIEDPILDNCRKACFKEFIDERIKPIMKGGDLIHLFGSVAYFNLPYLKPLLEELNLKLDIVAKEPLGYILGRSI